MIALAAYNYATTASALRGGYAINGEAFWFSGEHFASFFPFYVASLAIFPVAGLAALSPRGRTCSNSRQNCASSRRISGFMSRNSTITARSRKSGRAAPRSGIALNSMGRVASKIASS